VLGDSSVLIQVLKITGIEFRFLAVPHAQRNVSRFSESFEDFKYYRLANWKLLQFYIAEQYSKIPSQFVDIDFTPDSWISVQVYLWETLSYLGAHFYSLSYYLAVTSQPIHLQHVVPGISF